jgi:hypothetical protein
MQSFTVIHSYDDERAWLSRAVGRFLLAAAVLQRPQRTLLSAAHLLSMRLFGLVELALAGLAGSAGG